VDLAKPGGNIGFNQLDRLFHCGVCRFILPAVRPQMIATQNQAFLREPDLLSDVQYKIAKIGGLHAGVTAKLIDLIRGGFNQDFVV
jgi:hypothetical protein